MTEAPRLTSMFWEDLPLGAEYGPYRYAATPEDRRLCANIYGQSNDDGTLVPPALIPVFILRALRAAFDGIPAGGVLARQTFLLSHPVNIGQLFDVNVVVADKFVKRERTYVLLAFALRSADGDLVAESRQTLIWPSRGSTERDDVR